jgi:hypothetical protein
MTIKDWIENMSRSGLVCSEYMRKIAAADSREDIFRVLCDANGGNWLFEQHAKNVPLPIDDFCKEFANYLNGKRIVEYPQGYTSKFYCRSTEPDIDANTTLVYLLECMDMEVYVPKNKYPSVILSDGSQADVVLGEGARANIELYGDARVNLVGDTTKCRITKH